MRTISIQLSINEEGKSNLVITEHTSRIQEHFVVNKVNTEKKNCKILLLDN